MLHLAQGVVDGLDDAFDQFEKAILAYCKNRRIRLKPTGLRPVPYRIQTVKRRQLPGKETGAFGCDGANREQSGLRPGNGSAATGKNAHPAGIGSLYICRVYLCQFFLTSQTPIQRSTRSTRPAVWPASSPCWNQTKIQRASRIANTIMGRFIRLISRSRAKKASPVRVALL